MNQDKIDQIQAIKDKASADNQAYQIFADQLSGADPLQPLCVAAAKAASNLYEAADGAFVAATTNPTPGTEQPQ